MGGPFSSSIFRGLFIASLLLAFAHSPSAWPQEKRGASPADKTVDKTKMGPYRALAHLAYGSFQKGDVSTASEICQILERVWDKSEDYGGDTALSKTNPNLFKQIDTAMDEFITPLMNSAKGAPNPTAVKAAYSAYLEKLKLAD